MNKFLLSLLRTSLNCLALPPELQKKYFGPRSCVKSCITCELFEDFHHAFLCVDEGKSSDFTEEQNEQLIHLHEYLENMDDENFVCFDDSLIYNSQWVEVRNLSLEVLKKFNWDLVEDFEGGEDHGNGSYSYPPYLDIDDNGSTS